MTGHSKEGVAGDSNLVQANSTPSDSSLNLMGKQTSMADEARTFVGLLSATDGASEESVVVGQKIGKYEIRSKLGSGGMGEVYLAFDPLIERDVALKVLSADLSNSSTALKRFLGEARAIGRLNHPNVVAIYDIDLWNGYYFLVMELLSGGSVADRVDQLAALPWQEACRIVAEASRGLSAAHLAGMIHRDIKPENLMLSKEQAVKVVDFGLSKLLDSSLDPRNAVTKAGQILGTPQYMSPEQFEAGEVDARTDIYSLGATLFRLLTGRLPFHECQSILQVMRAHMTKPPPTPSAFAKDLPDELDRIIARSMAKIPADRYSSAAELADELESLILGRTSPVVTAAPLNVDRPLYEVLIVEPSKLQGAVFKDACVQAGAKNSRVVGDGNSAKQAVEASVPDLLMTAMQLSVGSGIDLLRGLCQQSRLTRTTVVLNSSGSTIEELSTIGDAAALILAPKKIRTDDVLRVAHATGPSLVSNALWVTPIDPTSVKLRIVLETSRIPDALADLIRELRILDVEMSVGDAATSNATAGLVLMLRRSEPSGGRAGFAHLTDWAAGSGPLVGVVHVDQGKLTLRAVRRQGVVAICQRLFDAPRLVSLFQSGQNCVHLNEC